MFCQSLLFAHYYFLLLVASGLFSSLFLMYVAPHRLHLNGKEGRSSLHLICRFLMCQSNSFSSKKVLSHNVAWRYRFTHKFEFTQIDCDDWLTHFEITLMLIYTNFCNWSLWLVSLLHHFAILISKLSACATCLTVSHKLPDSLNVFPIVLDDCLSYGFQMGRFSGNALWMIWVAKCHRFCPLKFICL